MQVPASTLGGPSSEDGTRGPASDMDPDQQIVWGTDIAVTDVLVKIQTFLNTYTEDGSDEPLYPRLLEDMRNSRTYNINLDCSNLKSFDEELYRQLRMYPTEIIPLFDLTIHELFHAALDEDERADETERIQVRCFNLDTVRPMRDLDPSDIDQLISVSGMITRSGGVQPDMKQAYFQCTVCNFAEEVANDRGRINEPQACTNCGTKKSMAIIHNRCAFADKQHIRLQETPESIPQGETPHTVTLYAYDALVDVARPGDRVQVTGIYRAVPIRSNPRQRALKAIYRTYIDVIHFQRNEKTSAAVPVDDPTAEDEYAVTFDEGDQTSSVSEERQRELVELASAPDIYDKLTAALAPSIWEMDDVKRGILCQLFGGAHKSFNSGSRHRGELNVLLCGDPGTSKSQLLQYVHKIAPRGIYTSGKGSSAVGLTAYVTRDPDTKEFVLESGALVLSDRGVCCIDEFDKMSDTTRAILHEAMEQQTVSIAKAGIIASLNARTSILASANPIQSRYNPRVSVVDNIDLGPTLLSRFDLIYLVLDKPNPESDRQLARHLVSLYYEKPAVPVPEISMRTLTDYIAYAKRNVHPTIPEDAATELIQGYIEMRQLSGNKKTISATPRQLESLIRLSEALARLHLRGEVTVMDVREARRLMAVALQQAATNTDGEIDMSLITTGRSASAINRQNDLATAILKILTDKRDEDGGTSLSMGDLVTQLHEANSAVPRKDIDAAISSLRADEKITYLHNVIMLA